MLDWGYSMRGLDSWLRSRDHLSAVELIRQGAQWTREPEQSFRVFAPVLKG